MLWLLPGPCSISPVSWDSIQKILHNPGDKQTNRPTSRHGWNRRLRGVGNHFIVFNMVGKSDANVPDSSPNFSKNGSLFLFLLYSFFSKLLSSGISKWKSGAACGIFRGGLRLIARPFLNAQQGADLLMANVCVFVWGDCVFMCKSACVLYHLIFFRSGLPVFVPTLPFRRALCSTHPNKASVLEGSLNHFFFYFAGLLDN